MPKLTVQNLAQLQVKIAPGQTLLKALQAHGHDWMHACGAKGRCTTCRLQVRAGLENLSPLSAAELRYQAAGRLLSDERLTCQTWLLTGDAAGRVPDATQLPHVRYREA